MKRNLRRVAPILAGTALILMSAYCGKNSSGNAVVVTITSPGTAQTVPISGTLPITASVTNTSNHGVTWSVNGVAGGNATFGTITGTGLTVVYNAPASVPSPASFNITVTSAADTGKSASLAVTISPGVEISITSPTSPQSLSVSSTLAFTATVTGATNTDVTWSVNGVANGNSTFGTISGTGSNVTYTAPPTVPTPATFSVTATSVGDISKSASVSVTITAGVGITITVPASSAANVPAQGSLGLTVAVFGTLNTGITWSVNGVTNGDATVGTINGVGLVVTFTAPASVPSPATYNITATSQADPSKSASVNVTITSAVPLACGSGNESVLNGQYAFLLKGYNHNGFAGVVGAITADGAGHITAGELDMNSTGAVAATHSNISASPTSFYSVGSDNRGCATIVTASGTTLRTRFDLGVISLNAATQGTIMEYDAANSGALIATGGIYRQTPNNFIVLEGGAYVHLLTGWDATAAGRMACGGIHTNSGGNISNSEETCNTAGTLVTTGPTIASTGTYTLMDTNGRFTEVVGPRNFVTYFVTQNARTGVPSELTLTTDVNPVMAGSTIFQMVNTYSQASLSGDYILFASGLNNASSGKIFLSSATSDGSSQLSLNNYDENDAGVWQSALLPPTYTYNVDFLGGVRLTRSLGIDVGRIYLTGTPINIYLGADSGAFAGYAVTQTGSGTFAASTLDGTYFGGTAEVVNQGATAELDQQVIDGTGRISLTTDSTSTATQAAGQVSAQTISIAPSGIITVTTDPSQHIGIAINQNLFVTTGNPASAFPTILILNLNTPPVS